MVFGFFLGILMIYILYKISFSFVEYYDNTPVLVCLIWILIIYFIFLYEYITWFSSLYSLKF